LVVSGRSIGHENVAILIAGLLDHRGRDGSMIGDGRRRGRGGTRLGLGLGENGFLELRVGHDGVRSRVVGGNRRKVVRETIDLEDWRVWKIRRL
jgi:hypothetical protein